MAKLELHLSSDGLSGNLDPQKSQQSLGSIPSETGRGNSPATGQLSRRNNNENIILTRPQSLNQASFRKNLWCLLMKIRFGCRMYTQHTAFGFILTQIPMRQQLNNHIDSLQRNRYTWGVNDSYGYLVFALYCSFFALYLLLTCS